MAYSAKNAMDALTSNITPKFAVSYLRVSTRGQAERGGGADEGFSTPAQREANKKNALMMGRLWVKNLWTGVRPPGPPTARNSKKCWSMSKKTLTGWIMSLSTRLTVWLSTVVMTLTSCALYENMGYNWCPPQRALTILLPECYSTAL